MISFVRLPVVAITTTYSNMFLAVGCIALLLALPYALATLRGRNEAVLSRAINVER